jgi:hypothetical protein
MSIGKTPFGDSAGFSDPQSAEGVGSDHLRSDRIYARISSFVDPIVFPNTRGGYSGGGRLSLGCAHGSGRAGGGRRDSGVWGSRRGGGVGVEGAEGRDFVQSLMVVDPRARMQPDASLQHPWLVTTSATSTNRSRSSI